MPVPKQAVRPDAFRPKAFRAGFRVSWAGSGLPIRCAPDRGLLRAPAPQPAQRPLAGPWRRPGGRPAPSSARLPADPRRSPARCSPVDCRARRKRARPPSARGASLVVPGEPLGRSRRALPCAQGGAGRKGRPRPGAAPGPRACPPPGSAPARRPWGVPHRVRRATEGHRGAGGASGGCLLGRGPRRLGSEPFARRAPKASRAATPALCLPRAPRHGTGACAGGAGPTGAASSGCSANAGRRGLGPPDPRPAVAQRVREGPSTRSPRTVWAPDGTPVSGSCAAKGPTSDPEIAWARAGLTRQGPITSSVQPRARRPRSDKVPYVTFGRP